MSLKDARRKSGLDNEEYWFHQKEQELIEKLKKSRLQVIEGGKGKPRQNPSSLEGASNQSQESDQKKSA